MTAPQDPQRYTLEEANEAILTDGWMIRPSGNGTRPWELVEVKFAHRNDIGLLYTWEEAAEIALGRPVVAHDPAAELRAALNQLLTAVEGTPSLKGLIDMVDAYYAPVLGDAEAAVQRARAALAATEGSE